MFAIRLAAAMVAVPTLGLAQAAAPAAPQEYRIDNGHSAVEFSIPFMYSPVRGRFDDVRGTLLYDPARPERSSASVVIGVRSIDSGSTQRDDHLRSADFFDAARFPVITFRTRSVRRAGAALVMSGPLTMHGVTRDVSIRFRPLRPPVAGQHGMHIANFTGGLKLARRDFGIVGGAGSNPWFDRIRSAAMGDSVTVTLEVQGWAPNFARPSDAVRMGLARIGRDGAAAMATQLRAEFARRPEAFRQSEWELGQLGEALLAGGRVPDALEILGVRAEIYPESSAAHAALGLAYARAGRGERAAASYRRALALDPNETRAMELQRWLPR